MALLLSSGNLGGKKLPAETEIHHWFCGHCAYINIRLQVMCLTLPSAPQSTHAKHYTAVVPLCANYNMEEKKL